MGNPDTPNDYTSCEVCFTRIPDGQSVCRDCLIREAKEHSHGDGTMTYEQSMRDAGRGHLL